MGYSRLFYLWFTGRFWLCTRNFFRLILVLCQHFGKLNFSSPHKVLQLDFSILVSCFVFFQWKPGFSDEKASLQVVNSKYISPLTSMSYQQRRLSEASSNCITFSLLTLNKEEGWSDLWRYRKSVLKRNKYDSLWVWWFPAPGSTCLFPVWSPGKFLEISQWRFTIRRFCSVSPTSGLWNNVSEIMSVSIPDSYCVGSSVVEGDGVHVICQQDFKYTVASSLLCVQSCHHVFYAVFFFFFCLVKQDHKYVTPAG